MRNCDKYSLEELLIAAKGNGYPAIVNGTPVNCEDLDCNVCDLSKNRAKCHGCDQAFLFWLYSEAEPEKEEDKSNTVNSPSHYTDGEIEVIDYIEDKGLGFCLGNAVKYISRAGKKDQSKEVEDLQKAIWYIQRRIEQIRKEKNNE